MNSFDLSLAVVKPTDSEVKASQQYTTKVDPKTDQPVRQTITDGGVTINKSMAPKLMLDGPLGYKYTELLNKTLSLESMSAIVAASDMSTEDTSNINHDPGKLSITGQDMSIESDPHAGYVYVVSADTLESRDIAEISSKLINQRLKSESKPIGLAMLTQGNPSPVIESLVGCIEHLGVTVTYTPEGLKSMISLMIKE